MPLQSFDEYAPINYLTEWDSSTATAAYQTVANGAAIRVRIDSFLATNDDAVNHVIDFAINHDATDFYVGAVSVPAGAGNAGTPPYDVGAALFAAATPYWRLNENEQLRASLAVALGAGSHIRLIGSAGQV